MNTNRLYNIEAEQNVLGSLISKNDLICEVADLITASDFGVSRHVVIYKAIEELYRDNKAIDIATLVNKLDKQVMSVGGITYISELVGSSLSSHVKDHALIVKEKSNMRKLKLILDKKVREITEGKQDAKAIVNDIENEFLKLSQYKESKMYSDSDLVEKTLNQIQKNYENGGGRY